ncbi:DUF502 domain-containing protein [Pontiella sulfatireligans]|uniref:DUF502 domain-containing protein n=1 Tax=Pontiella sulfatireligans TaxID=2750658 RepID=A0A6C2URF9_9BACT|nr:DUF502 domain-containing protein [Pontiella sulfatireligans]VGO22533.1 hypothetical protein SCARR_04617 [Pontiella sulfatireligans]
MLNRTKNFFKTTILGGVIVILPTIILIFAFKWLFGVVGGGIQPLTNLVVDNLTLPDRYDELIATAIVLCVIVLGCFMVGLFVRTRIGRWIYNGFESSLLSKAPGYKMVKETVNQFLGKKQSPFSSVALVQIFENDTKVTAFITDQHANGTVTVFVPTGPNPTSGFIYHLNEKYVHPVDVAVEDAMRSVISCGAGSGALINSMKKD